MKSVATTASVLLATALAQDPPFDAAGALNEAGLTSLANALGSEGQEDVLNTLNADTDGYTVFAPANDPLDQATTGLTAANLTAVLQYHVSADTFIPGDDTTYPAFIQTLYASDYLSDPQVIYVNPNDNGQLQVFSGAESPANVGESVNADPYVIHPIDAVLGIPASPGDVAGTAGLSTLVSLLSDNNLVEALNNYTDITIFAPTDAAFAAADLTQVDVTEVLLYHIAEGVYYSPDIPSGTTALNTKVSGKGFNVTASDDGVTVDDGQGNTVNVTQTNVLTHSGVVHVINGVLLPPAEANVDPDTDTDGDGDGTAASASTLSAALFILALTGFTLF